MKKHGLFLFHRDLRIIDNHAFSYACSHCDILYCCFIFTPEQISISNKYRSIHAIQFMLESLQQLTNEIQYKGGDLYCFYGKTDQIISSLIDSLCIHELYFNKDFTPYAILRDTLLQDICHQKQISCFVASNDYYLYEPGTVSLYPKFTSFYHNVISLPYKQIEEIKQICQFGTYTIWLENQQLLSTIYTKYCGKKNLISLVLKGGRKKGLQLLHSLTTDDSFTHITSHSQLSPFLKFGCISIREAYQFFLHHYGLYCHFIRQLIWRDYFAHLLFLEPTRLINIYEPLPLLYPSFHNLTLFDAWKTGHTGFPLIDACMRQLNQTGYIQHRGRILVACCLIQLFMIDWKKGEQYFAMKLIDYDVASNNGNWATIFHRKGFHIMNPWIQSNKYDHDCIYIKTWIPELQNVLPKDIHKWDIMYSQYYHWGIDEYLSPIVDYREQKKKFIHGYHHLNHHLK